MSPYWLLPLAALLHLAPDRCPWTRCSCMERPSVTVARAEADAVFLGTVVAVRDTVLREDGFAFAARAATLRLTRAYKGRLAGTATVITGRGGGDCGYDFRPGVRYLVYAQGGAGGLTTGICSRTQPEDEAREDLVWLARPAPR